MTWWNRYGLRLRVSKQTHKHEQTNTSANITNYQYYEESKKEQWYRITGHLVLLCFTSWHSGDTVFFVFTNWRQPCITRWWLAFLNKNVFLKIMPPILFYSFILDNIHLKKSFIYLTTPCSMWDLSFLTRDWNHAPFIENMESQHWITKEVPTMCWNNNVSLH